MVGLDEAASEASDDEEGPPLRLARRWRRLCGASLKTGGAWPGRSRIPRPKSVDDSKWAVEVDAGEAAGGAALSSSFIECLGDPPLTDDDELDVEPMSSERAGPNVRDGAPVMAVEVMRACPRDGLAERLPATDPLRGEPAGESDSGRAWMKQHRLPYGHEPCCQKVRQISDLNCERRRGSARARLREYASQDAPWGDEQPREAPGRHARTGT